MILPNDKYALVCKSAKIGRLKEKTKKLDTVLKRWLIGHTKPITWFD
jgi:hypothetical protein